MPERSIHQGCQGRVEVGGILAHSDVLVGAAFGSGLGALVPYLHGGPKVHLGKLEWLAIVLGPLVGVAVGELLPVGS
jgi:hypothetical protein